MWWLAYRYSVRVTDGSETYTAEKGVLTVTPDLEESEAVDEQTHAERMVPVLESEIEARITGTGSAHEDYMVAGRQIRKIPLTELKALLGRYRTEMRREQNPNQFSRNIAARFVCP